MDRKGKVQDFIVHTSQTQDVIFNPDGLNKPIDVKFMGSRMLVVDFGVFEPALNLLNPTSGKLWVVKAQAH